MKKIVLGLMAMMMTSSVVLAQEKKNENEPEQKRPTEEQLLEMQTKNLANRMMLDDATAQKFEKVYGEYQKELKALHPNQKKDKKPQAAPNGPRGKWNAPEKKAKNDAEIETEMKAKWNQMRKKADLQEKYYKEFRKFLTVKQTQQVLEATHHGHDGKKFGPRMGKHSGFPGFSQAPGKGFQAHVKGFPQQPKTVKESSENI